MSLDFNPEEKSYTSILEESETVKIVSEFCAKNIRQLIDLGHQLSDKEYAIFSSWMDGKSIRNTALSMSLTRSTTQRILTKIKENLGQLGY